MNNLLKAFLCLLMIIPLIVRATVIHVPADKATIQAGINAAVDGDTVLVAENTYFENINFKGKKITVASHFILDQDTSHISKTIIDGSKPSDPNKASVVTFNSGEDTTSVLCGFTITGGTGTFVNGTVMEGGGILIRYASAQICYNIIENNTAISTIERAFGGGIFALPYFTIIENNTIQNNLVRSSAGNAWGGGIYLQTSGRIVGNTIVQNEASYSGASGFSSLGGGIGCYGYDSTIKLEMRDNVISENYSNSTTTTNGGGLDLINAKLDFKGNTISNNKTNGTYNYGCGMRLLLCNGGIISNNTFSFNKPENGLTMAGGLLLVQTNDLEIEKNRFEGNEANTGGGILISACSNTIISENKFISNTITDYNGGGLSIGNSPNTKLIKNLIKGNTALSSSGGGVEIVSTQPDSIYKAWLINNTICENEALKGGGLFSEFAYLTIENTIFWGDSAGANDEIYYAGNSLNISYSDVQDSLWPGTGNISDDPLFADSLCHLGSGSSCIDAGNPDPAYYDEDGSINDMGVHGGITDSLISTITGLFEIVSKDRLPDEYVLSQNYPNPFNPVTNIEFQIPQTQFVTLTIYNILGQKIATLVSEKLLPGHYRYVWNASNFASGVYMYTLKTDKGSVQTKRLLLIK